MSLILKLYLFLLNAGIVGFAYFIDKHVAGLTKRLSDLTIWNNELQTQLDDLFDTVESLKPKTTTRRKTTT